ncbi:pyridoxal phosphate-dependent aminotransferase [Halolamina sp. CBA1230]|uniref:pyridoxal phosphate-dependent aminotransferase n=1 Tax=Halolamina sp. CBA1230 TaxID=1853690 RepID=UPI0009A1EEAD|nr:pyridoxal phosphate-dependent aminotransferase [Halolamina sp. CBA1230]QKY21502.1 pyridoxal phosphate-dependent aminotransferase [Halolamina sp. CBA1230]
MSEHEWGFAERVGRVEPSATVAVGNKASELQEQGVDVVDLSVGEPDFPTPERIREAGQQAIAEGNTGYTASSGIPELRQAISTDLKAKGVACGPENVVVTPGAKQALFETVQALVDEGDEVILLDPAWVSYEAMVKLAGGDLTRVDLGQHDFDLEPALDDLAAAISDETQLLLVNSPSNPTGAVFSDAALEGVRDLAVEHDVTVVADEIYDRITYDADPTSLASFDGMAERTVTVNGFSKAYSMTGWRLGYLAAPEALVDQVSKIHGHSVTCAPNFVQHAGVEALRSVESDVATMVEAFERRRDLVVDLLADHGKVIPRPQGAFYAMIPTPNDDVEWADAAIEDAHVATVPGSAFNAPGYARISYAASEERLKEGFERLAAEGLM